MWKRAPGSQKYACYLDTGDHCQSSEQKLPRHQMVPVASTELLKYHHNRSWECLLPLKITKRSKNTTISSITFN